MAGDQLLGMVEVALVLLEILERPAPEDALGLAAAREGQEHGQGDLALAEIVADALAQAGLARAVVQRVVDQLEGDAEIVAIGRERRLLGGRAVGDDGTDLAGGAEQGTGLGGDDARDRPPRSCRCRSR